MYNVHTAIIFPPHIYEKTKRRANSNSSITVQHNGAELFVAEDDVCWITSSALPEMISSLLSLLQLFESQQYSLQELTTKKRRLLKCVHRFRTKTITQSTNFLQRSVVHQNITIYYAVVERLRHMLCQTTAVSAMFSATSIYDGFISNHNLTQKH